MYLCATKGGPDSVRSAAAAGAVGAEGEGEGAGGGWITDLVAFATPSAADPYENCPAGYTKMGNATSGNLNSGSTNPGVMYLCYKTQQQLLLLQQEEEEEDEQEGRGISQLVGVIGNASACPSGMEAVQGTAAQPGPFDFDPKGPGLHLCFASLPAV